MSLSTISVDPAAAPQADTRVLLCIIWAATVLTYLVTSFGAGENLSTDDAMRLVQVRDLLAGQGWFDTTQYRLNPPDGVAMHWSRLIDLPIAVLIRAGATVLPQAMAERIATIVWPTALLLIFLAGVVRLARELAGDAAARLALIFAALTAPVLQHFRPGAIDHHNAQLTLLIWSLALIAPAEVRPRAAALAAMLCALSLAIGEEMAHAIAAIAALIALRWVISGEAARQATAAFAIAFAGATLALFAATVPSARYASTTCDALSIAQVAMAGIGGFGLAALTAVRGLSSSAYRLAGVLALALVLSATMAFAFPACLGDPLGPLGPRLSELWIAHNSEGRGLMSMLRDLPQEVLPYYGLPAVGLVLGVLQCLRERNDQRWPCLVSVAVLAALSIIAAWQVRGAAAANAVALALVPAALVRGLQASHDRGIFLGLGRAVLIAAILLSPLTLIGIGSMATRAIDMATGTNRPVLISGAPGTCQRSADYAPLARLPRGLVLAFIDAGPFLLMETPHTILAAPYHRNLKGNAATFDVFLGTPGEAAARVRELGVDYVAFCAGAPERYNYAAAAPDGLAATLGRGDVPAWLEPIALDGTDLAIYRTRWGIALLPPATILLPNSVARGDSGQHGHPPLLDSGCDFSTRRRSPECDETAATEFRVRCIRPLCHLSTLPGASSAGRELCIQAPTAIQGRRW
jgi:hypothetical protein